MIDLPALAELASRYPSALDAEVAPIRIGSATYPAIDAPVIMGTVNLSQDSTYRDSIAFDTESAVRKVRVAAAQGAAVVDVGAESTNAGAARVDDSAQIAQLVPVIEQCAAAGIAISVETYSPHVTRACLAAGAVVLNMTGAGHQDEIFALAAEYGATVVVCYSPQADVRHVSDVDVDGDPIPALAEHFQERIARARSLGADELVIDPGMGFFYGNLTDPQRRVQHQSRVLLNAFRLRELGLPICQALPHALRLFEEGHRAAEGFFAVLARLGSAGMLRTHEVALVRSVTQSMAVLDTGAAHWSS